jgi:hypothetical protein
MAASLSALLQPAQHQDTTAGFVFASAAPGRRLLASRSGHYVNVTYDFDTFASLSLPTTVSVRLQSSA